MKRIFFVADAEMKRPTMPLKMNDVYDAFTVSRRLYPTLHFQKITLSLDDNRAVATLEEFPPQLDIGKLQAWLKECGLARYTVCRKVATK
ncbi:MAG: hypothetical protein QE263_04705 [Vampirovibrionales bacterium]|nr:hypothetical protein [Vampirovibrionales bacterium]